MEKEEYLRKMDALKNKIGMWNIMTEGETNAAFVMGYYFNTETNMYDVYINNERGKRRIRLSTADEKKALKKLLDMIEFEVESNG